MDLKEYFSIDLNTALISAIIGAVVGYLSMVLVEPLYALGLAILVLAGLRFLLQALFKIEKETKWWISNSFVVYVMVWFIVWSILYTLNMHGML